MEDSDTLASKYILRGEKLSLEASMRLDFEIQRLGNKANTFGADAETTVAPLVEMQNQNEEIKSFAQRNRELLNSKGASVEFVAEIERWAGTCEVFRTQVDLTAEQIEQSLEDGRQV
ncbi:MAG: hypothetical protein AAF198_05120 [Pseudomonadota bacterium]